LDSQQGLTRADEPTIELWWPRSTVAQVVLGGEHDLASAPELSDTLAAALVVCTHLIVDLTEAEFIDSSTMRAILIAKHETDATDRRFNLVLDGAAVVEKALAVSGLLDVLNRVHTLDEALAES
jgi:anti-anti-sigma factor